MYTWIPIMRREYNVGPGKRLGGYGYIFQKEQNRRCRHRNAVIPNDSRDFGIPGRVLPNPGPLPRTRPSIYSSPFVSGRVSGRVCEKEKDVIV